MFASRPRPSPHNALLVLGDRLLAVAGTMKTLVETTVRFI